MYILGDNIHRHQHIYLYDKKLKILLVSRQCQFQSLSSTSSYQLIRKHHALLKAIHHSLFVAIHQVDIELNTFEATMGNNYITLLILPVTRVSLTFVVGLVETHLSPLKSRTQEIVLILDKGKEKGKKKENIGVHAPM